LLEPPSKKRLKNRRPVRIIQRVAAPMTPISAPSPRVESPCIKVCKLDAHEVCVGCGRTLEEIADWSRLTDEQQRAVCIKAAARIARRGSSLVNR
jgi:predicted Fe-S protein YdhL (DUF1289 family)